MGELTLYNYYRSSCSYRVRIALNLKQLHYDRVDIDLAASEQFGEDYRRLNPQSLVPALNIDETLITQSLAIVEWLEERFPEPVLLPGDSVDKARVRALSYAIAMDIQPLNNLRVMNYFRQELAWEEAEVMRWYRHWIAKGFTALESQLSRFGCGGHFCFGDAVTMADICLVPQVYNAQRFECDLSPYPLISGVAQHCNALEAFARAAPEATPA